MVNYWRSSPHHGLPSKSANKLFGFRGGDDAEFAGRGRGGQGRGGAPKTEGRKCVKQALKKTDMDFPTL